MKKYLIVIVPIVLVLLISAYLCFICFGETKSVNKLFTDDISSVTISQVNDQYKVNDKLDNISKDKKYTFNNAYTELNPYGISPLSGIIIFNTNTEEEVLVYINDVFFTKMEETKEHIIPVYGLYENYNNKVTLKMEDEVVDYYFLTEASNLDYTLDVKKASKELTVNDIYFTIASYKTHLTGWDKDSKLRFYLTVDNSMDVEWLDNGHFLIGVTQGANREQYIGFVEMDYLGKIYNYYTLKNGYSFEFQILKDGNYLVAGGDVPVYFKHQMITTLDKENGNVLDSIDIYDIVKNIDPTFNETYLGPAAIRNGFYLNEDTNELAVSFRDINTIWCFDYKEKKLLYVLTDPNSTLFTNDVWKNYLIKVDTNRYPLAQHSPQLIGNKLLYFNNGYDRFNIKNNGYSDNTLDNLNNYTDVVLLDIDKDKLTAKTVWKYDGNKKYFSIKYGYSRMFEDNHKLMNFGYILKDNYRNKSNKIADSEKNPDNIYTKILELDEKDNVYFEAISEEGKYRTFKNVLYKDVTSNVNVSELNTFNTIPNDKLDVISFKKIDFDNTIEWINSINLTRNTFKTDYEIKETDSVDLYFVNKSGRVFILNYKNKDTKDINRIFNIPLYNDNYVLFIKVNDILYKTNKVYEF